MSSSPPRAGRARRGLLVVGVAALVLCADQVTKSLAVAHLGGPPVHLVGPLSLALAYNTGIAFSLGTGLTLPIVLAVVCIVGLLAWMAKGVPSALGSVAIGSVLGGALGNLGDRLFRGHHGAVVDFVYTTFWPTFNLADAAIVVGSILLVVAMWRTSSSERATPSGEAGG